MPARRTDRQGLAIRLQGRVQGVGMRPALYRLARRLGLRGEIGNAGDGVVLRLWGPETARTRFVAALGDALPPQARLDAVHTAPLDAPPPPDLRIVAGRPGVAAGFPLDLAVCPDCLAEVADPGSRRHRYPFTHCAACGPRFSVLERLPYERAHTTLRVFPPCPACAREYRDPGDRRFHAEAIACPTCGPRLWTWPATEGDPLARAVAWLRAGRLVAVRGVGGFQLLADATDGDAVARLRARKHRPDKPLALMARDLGVIRRYARVTPAAAAALSAASAPIVLLDRTGGAPLAPAVAPGLDRLGFVLPYTPLHHLLLAGFDTPLVFTSANPSGAPLCIGNAEALERLGGIADGFLLHDREIAHRLDDSVVMEAAGRVRVIRAASGIAPQSLPLPAGFGAADGVLALGGDLKARFCLLHRGRAVLSPHQGDLGDARVFSAYREALAAHTAMLGFRCRHLAVDRHPGYHGARWGRARAAAEGLALTEVQHHHAHLAACLAECGHPLDGGPVLGVILDGLGWGTDGTFWGGELLWGDYRTCRRLARLRPAPLPGGTRAVTEPWRNLLARLWQVGLDPGDWPVLGPFPVAPLSAALARGLNCPPASSCGRLFDAVAAALGLCAARQSYEGQAAAALEALARRASDGGAYPFALGAGELDPAPLWPALLADLRAGVPRETVARRFHLGLARAWAALVVRRRPPDCDTVVLSGGVFQNRLLLETMRARLEAAGLRVWIPARIPMNDGGLALGQALIAAAGGG